MLFPRIAWRIEHDALSANHACGTVGRSRGDTPGAHSALGTRDEEDAGLILLSSRRDFNKPDTTDSRYEFTRPREALKHY